MKIRITENQLNLILESEIENFDELRQNATCTTVVDSKISKLPPCRSYEEAKKWANEIAFKKFGITGKEKWYEYFNLNPDKKPFDIPKDPNVYKGKGFTTWGDFLGSGVHSKKYRKEIAWTYKEAKNFMTNYPEINTGAKFYDWHKKNRNTIKELKLGYIPASPADVYEKDNFNWGDFLSTDRKSNVAINKYYQEGTNWLKTLFQSKKFKYKLSFNKNQLSELDPEKREKILNNRCNDKFKNLIPDGFFPKYCYDKVLYKNNYSKILVGCKIHSDSNFGTGEMGYFSLTPNDHLDTGSGCPQCLKDSGGEIAIEQVLNNLGLNFSKPKDSATISQCIGKGGKCLKFDFKLFDDYDNIYIEFDGSLHFKSRSDNPKDIYKFLSTVRNDDIRNKYFIGNKDLKLIRISYTRENYINKILTKEFLDKVKNSKGPNIFTCSFPYTPIIKKYRNIVLENGFKLYGEGTILPEGTYQSICP